MKSETIKSYPNWIRYVITLAGVVSLIRSVVNIPILSSFSESSCVAVIGILSIIASVCLFLVANRSFWAYMTCLACCIGIILCSCFEPAFFPEFKSRILLQYSISILVLSALVFIPFKDGESLFEAMKPISVPFQDKLGNSLSFFQSKPEKVVSFAELKRDRQSGVPSDKGAVSTSDHSLVNKSAGKSTSVKTDEDEKIPRFYYILLGVSIIAFVVVIIVNLPKQTTAPESVTIPVAEESGSVPEPVYIRSEFSRDSNNTSESTNKNRRLIESAIREYQKKLPATAEAGMVIKKVSIEGNYVMYLVECDEDVYDMNSMKEVSSEIKQDMLESMPAEPFFKIFAENCKKANVGICYRYKGTSSGQSFVVRISPEEL